jgi:hypothetical protein
MPIQQRQEQKRRLNPKHFCALSAMLGMHVPDRRTASRHPTLQAMKEPALRGVATPLRCVSNLAFWASFGKRTSSPSKEK